MVFSGAATARPLDFCRKEPVSIRRPGNLNADLKFARLYGALQTDVEVSVDLDHQDAQDVVVVARALRDLRGRVHARNVSPITNSLRTRGFLEQAWEKRRRRGRVLNNKFASGSLWSEAAHRLAFDDGVLRERSAWSGSLMLEHVVPARVIAHVVDDMLDTSHEVERVREVLYALHHHVVLTRMDNAALRSSGLSSEEVLALREHFSGANVLADAELEKLIWIRYPDEMIRALVVPQPEAPGS